MPGCLPAEPIVFGSASQPHADVVRRVPRYARVAAASRGGPGVRVSREVASGGLRRAESAADRAVPGPEPDTRPRPPAADEKMGGYESESERLLGGTPGPRLDPQSLPEGNAAERARTSRLKEWSCIILGAFALIVATLVVVTHSHASNAAAAAHDSSLKVRPQADLAVARRTVPRPVPPSHAHEQVVASENDDRQYRFTVLDNGLEVLLVSDPSTSRSAAAMDVRVGHFSDPVRQAPNTMPRWLRAARIRADERWATPSPLTSLPLPPRARRSGLLTGPRALP